MKLSSTAISVIDTEDRAMLIKKKAYKKSNVNVVNITDFTKYTPTSFQNTTIKLPIIKKKICHKQTLTKNSSKSSKATLLISSDKLNTKLSYNCIQNQPAYSFPKRSRLAPIILYKRAVKPLISSFASPILTNHSRNYQSIYFYYLLITNLSSQNTSANLNT
jgi:hypothetical protein